jgi:cation-transporting P-type ATPase E
MKSSNRGIPKGLSLEQVRLNREKYGSNVDNKKDFTNIKVIFTSIISLYNVIIFSLIVILIFIRAYNDAIFLGLVGIVNTLVSLYQEIRARIAIKKLSTYKEKNLSLIRNVNGKDQVFEFPSSEAVIDDIVYVQTGDRIMLDGIVVSNKYSEFDESILTGESDYVSKNEGEEVQAGTYIAAGSCYYKVTKLSKDSYMQVINKRISRIKSSITPLQKKINQLIKYLTYITLVIIFLIVVSSLIQDVNRDEAIRNSVSIVTSLVPQGLVLITTISFAFGALKIAEFNGLVQRINAVESMANVKVICMDKTGTLTQNILKVIKVIDVNSSARENEERLLSTFMYHVSQKNKTILAITDHLSDIEPYKELIKTGETPFSSERKYSSISFTDFTLVLGAPEIIISKESMSDELKETIKKYEKKSYRVLLFGKQKNETDFKPLSIIVIEDLIREDILDTLKTLYANAIEVKIISGDSAETVIATAKRISKNFKAKAINGYDLELLPKKEFEKTVLDTNIFARIKPQQKQQIIKVLKKHNIYTAMVGDGANDILALKEAQLGIAMNDGSSMAKDVADVVLLNNSFATLPIMLQEGKKIILNVQNIANIYLIKNISSLILILFTTFLGFGFPYDPKHIALASFLVIGIPSFILAFDEQKVRINGNKTNHFFINILAFSSKVGIMNAAVLLAIFWFATNSNGSLYYIRTLILCGTIILGIINIILIYLRTYSFKELLHKKLVILMIVGILLSFVIDLSSKQLKNFFDLDTIYLPHLLIIFAICALGILLYMSTEKVKYKKMVIFISKKIKKLKKKKVKRISVTNGTKATIDKEEDGPDSNLV